MRVVGFPIDAITFSLSHRNFCKLDSSVKKSIDLLNFFKAGSECDNTCKKKNLAEFRNFSLSSKLSIGVDTAENELSEV